MKAKVQTENKTGSGGWLNTRNTTAVLESAAPCPTERGFRDAVSQEPAGSCVLSRQVSSTGTSCNCSSAIANTICLSSSYRRSSVTRASCDSLGYLQPLQLSEMEECGQRGQDSFLCSPCNVASLTSSIQGCPRGELMGRVYRALGLDVSSAY